MITGESLMVFDFLFFIAEYSSQENSQAVASKECWPGDLLPETLFGQSMIFHFCQVFKSIVRTNE